MILLIQTVFFFSLSLSPQNEVGMSVRDRIGFACNFLSDALLQAYIENLNRVLVKEGNLDGMLITGISTENLEK